MDDLNNRHRRLQHNSNMRYSESGEAQGAMFQSSMQYPDYGDDRRETPGLGGYDIYGVPQTIIPSDVTGSYPSFGPGTAGALSSQSQTGPNAVAGSYRQAQLPSFHSTHPPGMMSRGSSGQLTMEEAAAYAAGVRDPDATRVIEERWAEYQTKVGMVYRGIQSVTLEPACKALLELSNWLGGQISLLGLHLDNPELWPNRIKLWETYNNAWLALLQKQLDIMNHEYSQLQRGQSALSQDNLEVMASELIKLCDGIERHGLVDYHYGVWEERITELLIECSNQLENDDDD